ncbi:MAG: TIGR01440 family protein [Eubacterium sp.]|nr:TIGR01440 family protein [Eubacterium sp.]
MSKISDDANAVFDEILSDVKLNKGDIFVVGCSSSEMIGNMMGTSKDGETDKAVNDLYEVVSTKLAERGVFLAVQCCEHLNRAIVIDRAAMERYDLEEVNVIPQLHAGGAFAVKQYLSLKDPVVVEDIKHKAKAGIDIGGVLIGMHIHPVVVPLRLKYKNIGEANVIAARFRPKFVGGERAVYNADLM